MNTSIKEQGLGAVAWLIGIGVALSACAATNRLVIPGMLDECQTNSAKCEAECATDTHVSGKIGPGPGDSNYCDVLQILQGEAVVRGQQKQADIFWLRAEVKWMTYVCDEGIPRACAARDGLRPLLATTESQYTTAKDRVATIQAKLAEANRISDAGLAHQMAAKNALAQGDLATADREADAALDAANRQVANAQERARAADAVAAAQQGAATTQQSAIDAAEAECDADLPQCQAVCATSTASEKCPHLAALVGSGDPRISKTGENIPLARAIAKRSCAAGNDHGCTVLTNVNNVDANCSDEPSCKARCNAGVGSACVAWGDLYKTGNGVPKSLARANTLYQQACDADSSRGCFLIAAAYIEGIGVRRNIQAAHDPLVKACDLGEQMACQTYCEMLGLNRMADARCVGPFAHPIGRARQN
jgi:TPR repeat protein